MFRTFELLQFKRTPSIRKFLGREFASQFLKTPCKTPSPWSSLTAARGDAGETGCGLDDLFSRHAFGDGWSLGHGSSVVTD